MSGSADGVCFVPKKVSSERSIFFVTELLPFYRALSKIAKGSKLSTTCLPLWFWVVSFLLCSKYSSSAVLAVKLLKQ